MAFRVACPNFQKGLKMVFGVYKAEVDYLPFLFLFYFLNLFNLLIFFNLHVFLFIIISMLEVFYAV
jgi:hypothetical protein